MTLRPFLMAALLCGCVPQSDPKSDEASEPGPSPDVDSPAPDVDDPVDTSDPGDTGDTGAPPVSNEVAVFVLSVPDAAHSADFSVLAAIPASARVNGGAPAVLALRDITAPSAATTDLLHRLSAETAYVASADVSVDGVVETISLDGSDPHTWSVSLAQTFWTASDHAVVVADDDYAAGVLGASLAALLGAPLLIDGPEGAVQDTVDALGAQAITLGVAGEPPVISADATVLAGVDDALEWVAARELAVSYLAVTNAEDRSSGRSQKASLVASMYAANRGGLSIPVAVDMPTVVVDDRSAHPILPLLTAAYDQLGAPPTHLAIVGAHDALPQTRGASIFDNPVAEHPVSDLPYGEIDADPFLDVAIGRIVGDTLEELSTTATRIAQYEQLQDGVWERGIVESGLWGFDELRATNANVGFDAPRHLLLEDIEAVESLEMAAFLHKDHSYCQVLGHGVDLGTTTLFSPAITVSRGCSVGGMDLLREDQRSIVDHLFGQGMVAFVGASRNAIAENTLIEVSMWNQLLEGRTLGASFQHGINDAIVHWLDDGSAGMRYSIDIEMVYGDPAFRLHVPDGHQTAPAAQRFDGTTLTVTAPEAWTMVAYHPEMLAEWNYEGELFMYTAPGTSPRTYWAGRYDHEDMYFGVQLPLDRVPVAVSELGSHPRPLGWGGQAHIDAHADGTATALWRIRLLDFDPQTGEVRSSAAAFDYTVE